MLVTPSGLHLMFVDGSSGFYELTIASKTLQKHAISTMTSTFGVGTPQNSLFILITGLGGFTAISPTNTV